MWGRSGSQAVLGLPPFPPPPPTPYPDVDRVAEGIPLLGSPGGTAGSGAPCWRGSAAQRPCPELAAAQASPCWAQDYVTREKGNESPPQGGGAARGECGDADTGTWDNGGK